MRKRVFGSFRQVRLKLACSATEASMWLEILVTETRDITLSRSAPLLFAYDMTHFLMARLSCNIGTVN